MRPGDLRQGYFGVYVATVVDNDDPDGLGRVRIECDQVGDTSDDPLWATVTRPLASNGPTVFFTPRAGDQVIVAYVAGDPREPVILGSAHHSGRTPDSVGPRRHAIVTDIGRITLDEEAQEIVIDYRGTQSSRVTMTSSGVSVEVGSNRVEVGTSQVVMKSAENRVEVGPATVAINAPVTMVQGTLIAPTVQAGSVQTGSLSATGGGGAGAPSAPEPPLAALTDAKLRAKNLVLEAQSIAIVGAEVCINGQAVVLKRFLTDVYENHTHDTVNGPSPSTAADTTTECAGG